MIIVRVVLFFLIAVYILLGPFLPQVAKYNSNIFRRWTMFTSAGRNICEVSFTERYNEKEQSLSYLSALGFSSRSKAPRSYVCISSREKAFKLANEICKKFKFKKDIRMYARQGSRSHWVVFASGEENMCKAAQGKNAL
jgi:hypothetical protein